MPYPAMVPMLRFGRAGEIAAAIAFLLSDGASDLLRGADGLTVADVAMRWGLMHTGRFAAAYRRTYGESPSETLRGRHPIPQ